MTTGNFLDEYNKGDRSEKERSAYEYLVTKLISDKVQGADKTDTIYGMNLEDKLKGNIYPSMVYTFQYASPKPAIIAKIAYMDVVPLLLCMVADSKYVEGINFNMLPNNVRASVLDEITSSYKFFYDKLGNDEVLGINEDFAKLCVNETTRKGLLLLLDMKLGVRVSMAYRRYSRSYMSNIRLVEYDHWKDIPYLCFNDAFRGATLADFQKAIAESNR